MNCVLHSYPLYKHSGVSWLGTVPEHWSVRRIKTLFRELDERSGDGQGELLSLTRSNGLVPHWQASNRIASVDDLSNYKVCRSGALVMNRMQAWSGMFAVASQDGLISPDYCVFGPVGSCVVKYFEHLFKTPLVVSQFARQSKGIGSGFNRLYTDDFGCIPVLVPPLPEQRAIVRYLDHADRRIQRYVTAKRKLVTLLEEEKQAVINRAVTRGLDPNVRLKPSGDVPEHWEVRPVKRAFISMDYGISESASDSGAIRLLTMGHLKDGQVIVPNDGGVDFVAPYLLLEEGDLLFNRTNSQELVGKVGLFVGHNSPVTFASYLVRMRPHPWHEPEYLNLALNATSFISRARREAIPSLHQSNLNPTRYGRIQIALPSKEEQRGILRTLQEETASLGAAITRARRQIELVQEYRTRLIADVVTGKLDVREAAARLPDEADHQGPVEEGGPLGDDMVGEGGLQDKELRCHSHGVSLRAGGQ